MIINEELYYYHMVYTKLRLLHQQMRMICDFDTLVKLCNYNLC